MVNKARVGKSFVELLEACRRSKFVDFIIEDNVVRQLSLTPIGRMLYDNLRKQWNHMIGSSMAGTTSVPVYTGSGSLNLRENFNFIRENYPLSFPFGLTVEQEKSNYSVMLGDHFSLELPVANELCTTYLVPPQMAKQFLYQTQRQRKIWWMRFSDNPGRYFISDAKASENAETTTVSICSRFAERMDEPIALELEHLELLPKGLGEDELDKLHLTVPNSKKKIKPSVVRVRHELTRATLAILMDALESHSSGKCVKIHRKIAPFKCGIVYQSQDDSLRHDLEDLSKHLSIVLRKAQISVLNCALEQHGKTPESSYQRRIAHLDVIGVPYTIVLNNESLKTGLMQLRSRDTTLCETIHISDLPEYLIKIVAS
ncbi:DNA polymerase subunit gamma-2, mitochondrial [Anopheles ziemanni]|nr:DNA polymerase subunit gamma-2, mitochondrial [Anopheles ziemanni]